VEETPGLPDPARGAPLPPAAPPPRWPASRTPRAFLGAFLGYSPSCASRTPLVMAGANMYIYTIIRGIVIFFAVMIDCMRNTGELR